MLSLLKALNMKEQEKQKAERRAIQEKAWECAWHILKREASNAEEALTV